MVVAAHAPADLCSGAWRVLLRASGGSDAGDAGAARRARSGSSSGGAGAGLLALRAADDRRESRAAEGDARPKARRKDHRAHRRRPARGLRAARPSAAVAQHLPRHDPPFGRPPRGAPAGRGPLQPGARRRDDPQPAPASAALGRAGRRHGRQRAGSGGSGRHHQGRVEPPGELERRLHLRRARGARAAPRGAQPLRAASGGERHLPPAALRVHGRDRLHDPAHRGLTHRRGQQRGHHGQPGERIARRVVRIARGGPAPLLGPDRVGLGREHDLAGHHPAALRQRPARQLLRSRHAADRPLRVARARVPDALRAPAVVRLGHEARLHARRGHRPVRVPHRLPRRRSQDGRRFSANSFP